MTAVTLIAAVGSNGVIGADNAMPWHLPEDFAFFKRTTMGHAMLMGRRTFDSIGRVLPGRRTIVITHQSGWTHPDVETAHSVAGALALVGVGMGFGPTRALLDRVLPAPGDGPSEQVQRNGRFRMELMARTSTGARYRAVVAAQGDPGYAATSVMLGESALCLALDRDRLPVRAGMLTPATAMGDELVVRLRAAGFTLTVGAA